MTKRKIEGWKLFQCIASLIKGLMLRLGSKRKINKNKKNEFYENKMKVGNLVENGDYKEASRLLKRSLRLAKQYEPSRITEVIWSREVWVKLRQVRDMIEDEKGVKRFKIRRLLDRTQRFIERNKDQDIMGKKLKDYLAWIYFFRSRIELKKKPEKALYNLRNAEEHFSKKTLSEQLPAIQQTRAVAYWRCGYMGLAYGEVDKALKEIDKVFKKDENKQEAKRAKSFKDAAESFKGALEDISNGLYMSKLPSLRRLWLFGFVILVLASVLFLSILRVEGYNVSLLEYLFNLCCIRLVSEISESIHTWLRFLTVVSFIAIAVWTFFPLLRFIRRLNVPGAGDINLTPFLVEISESMIRHFIPIPNPMGVEDVIDFEVPQGEFSSLSPLRIP